MQLVRVRLLSAGLGHQRAEVSIADQLTDAHLEADGVQDVFRPADHARLQAEWCGGQPDRPHPRIDHLGVVQKLPIHPFAIWRDKMCLVHNDQIEGIQLAGPFVDRLDARNDHRVLGIAAA